MDELNRIIEKNLDDMGYYFSDELTDIYKASDIILSYDEPCFRDKIKTRYGISKSVDLAYQFFNSFDKEYGDYFQEKLNDDTYFFEHDNYNGKGNAQSTYSINLGRNIVYIPYRNRLTDAFAIVHETFHIMNLDFENLSFTRNMFTEYISIFGEFLFEKFIEDNYDINSDRYNNNCTFSACYAKALKTKFQLDLVKCYLENGYVNNYNFNSIISSFPKEYKTSLLKTFSNIVVNGEMNFDYQMRYIIGILLSCYSYDRFLNDDFNIDIFKLVNEKINFLHPIEVYQYLDLDVIDDYNLILSPDSYEKLGKSYKKIIGKR